MEQNNAITLNKAGFLLQNTVFPQFFHCNYVPCICWIFYENNLVALFSELLHKNNTHNIYQYSKTFAFSVATLLCLGIRWLYTLEKNGGSVLGMILNFIWWWSFNSGEYGVLLNCHNCPCPLWSGVVLFVRILSMTQIDLFNIYLYSKELRTKKILWQTNTQKSKYEHTMNAIP